MSELYQIPADIRNEFIVTEDGRVFAKSWTAVARLAGVRRQTIMGKLLTRLKVCTLEQLPISLKPLAGKDLKSEKNINVDVVKCILQYYYIKGVCTKEGCLFLEMPYLETPVKKRIVELKNRKCYEKLYQTKIQKLLGGQIEVVTLAGRIDVLTSTEIIEVKCIKDWKDALGQVLVYSDYYPSHQKRIHLYGETQEKYLEMIRFHCSKRDVVVTWEQ